MFQKMSKAKKISTIMLIGAITIFAIGNGGIMIYRNIPRVYMGVGYPEAGDTVSNTGKLITNKNKLEELYRIIREAKEIKKPDTVQGIVVHFELSYGKYTDTMPKYYGTVWYQEDGTAVIEDNMDRKYYRIEKEDAKSLKAIVKPKSEK